MNFTSPAPRARFAYYDSLSEGSKRTYRKSDALLRIAVPDMASLPPLATAIEPVLAAGDRAGVERACQALVDGLNTRLATPPIIVRVLERRPANNDGELQGLYEPDEVTGGTARISVWMRKLPNGVDSLKLDFSGRILHPGRFNEEIKVQRVADRDDPEGGGSRRCG